MCRNFNCIELTLIYVIALFHFIELHVIRCPADALAEVFVTPALDQNFFTKTVAKTQLKKLKDTLGIEPRPSPLCHVPHGTMKMSVGRVLAYRAGGDGAVAEVLVTRALDKGFSTKPPARSIPQYAMRGNHACRHIC